MSSCIFLCIGDAWSLLSEVSNWCWPKFPKFNNNKIIIFLINWKSTIDGNRCNLSGVTEKWIGALTPNFTQFRGSRFISTCQSDILWAIEEIQMKYIWSWSWCSLVRGKDCNINALGDEITTIRLEINSVWVWPNFIVLLFVGIVSRWFHFNQPRRWTQRHMIRGHKVDACPLDLAGSQIPLKIQRRWWTFGTLHNWTFPFNETLLGFVFYLQTVGVHGKWSILKVKLISE